MQAIAGRLASSGLLRALLLADTRLPAWLQDQLCLITPITDSTRLAGVCNSLWTAVLKYATLTVSVCVTGKDSHASPLLRLVQPCLSTAVVLADTAVVAQLHWLSHRQCPGMQSLCCSQQGLSVQLMNTLLAGSWDAGVLFCWSPLALLACTSCSLGCSETAAQLAALCAAVAGRPVLAGAAAALSLHLSLPTSMLLLVRP